MVYEQLRDKCNCVDVREEDVKELINLISLYTCWSDKPCETFLMGKRRQVIDVPDCMCGCGVFTFEPFYYPFNVDSFTFTLVSQTGISETSVTVGEVAYSETDEVFKMILPIPSCECKPSNCGCPTKYKLVVEYMAGYETIPDCLIPLFCNALKYIKEKNDCPCNKCDTCDTDNDRIEIVEPDAAKLEDRLKYYFINMLTEQYKRQLSLISVCRADKDIWGIVV